MTIKVRMGQMSANSTYYVVPCFTRNMARHAKNLSAVVCKAYTIIYRPRGPGAPNLTLSGFKLSRGCSGGAQSRVILNLRNTSKLVRLKPFKIRISWVRLVQGRKTGKKSSHVASVSGNWGHNVRNRERRVVIPVQFNGLGYYGFTVRLDYRGDLRRLGENTSDNLVTYRQKRALRVFVNTACSFAVDIGISKPLLNRSNCVGGAHVFVNLTSKNGNGVPGTTISFEVNILTRQGNGPIKRRRFIKTVRNPFKGRKRNHSVRIYTHPRIYGATRKQIVIGVKLLHAVTRNRDTNPSNNTQSNAFNCR
jgi:hypothetical protein